MIDSLWVDYALCIYSGGLLCFSFFFVCIHTKAWLICIFVYLMLFSFSLGRPYSHAIGVEAVTYYLFSCLPDVAVADSCET